MLTTSSNSAFAASDHRRCRFPRPAGQDAQPSHHVPPVLVFVWFSMILFANCTTKNDVTIHAKPGATLYVAQAQFINTRGSDGEVHPSPGPARLEILTRTQTGWDREILEDPQSKVFHKAIWYKPPFEEPGVLTIGATEAYLKLWRKNSSAWTAETLWHPTFGGTFDRLRDFEVGDVTGDHIDDVVIATHDQGVVAVACWDDSVYRIDELTRQAETFVHEIEIGDVDGDGIMEIFSTPSRPNKLDGSIQPGEIHMFKTQAGRWANRLVDRLESRHAKEILCATLFGEDRPVLFAALEGESLGRQDQNRDSTTIRMYRFAADQITSSDVAGLPGEMCRFLTFGDTDGDGRGELVASTKSSGIWKLTPPGSPDSTAWHRELIATGSSGFEHATCLVDLDEDGVAELYVASDDQGELRCYRFDGKKYQQSLVSPLKADVITFNIGTHPF